MSQKILLGAMTALVVLAFIMAGYFIASPIIEWAKEKPAEQKIEKAQTPATANKKTVDEIPASRKIVGMIIVAILLVGFFVDFYSRWESGKKFYEQAFLRDSVGVTIYCLIAVYLLIAFLFPKHWDVLWGDQVLFWTLTLGVITLVRIRAINTRAAHIASLVFGGILILGLGTQISRHWSWENTDTIGESSKIHRGLSGSRYQVPMDVALPIIAECESGGRQFENDGVTPLKNKEGSSAIGKYQILASAHEERAKMMGLDIKTLEGNEGYAKVLYQESGTKHWEVDPRTKACRESRFAALGYGPKGSGQITVTLEAPVGKWAEPVKMARGFTYSTISEFSSGKAGRPKYRAEYTTSRGVFTREFPIENGITHSIPGDLSTFRAMSLDNEPVVVKIVLSPI